MAKKPKASSTGRVVAETHVHGGVTYQREWVRCGRRACGRCPHGPYWYAYAWDSKRLRLRSRYIGRELRFVDLGMPEAQSNSKRSRRIAARAPKPKRPSARAKKRAA